MNTLVMNQVDISESNDVYNARYALLKNQINSDTTKLPTNEHPSHESNTLVIRRDNGHVTYTPTLYLYWSLKCAICNTSRLARISKMCTSDKFVVSIYVL